MLQSNFQSFANIFLTKIITSNRLIIQMEAMKWIIKRVKFFAFSITSWNKILFDRSRKQLVTIEFGGNTVVKTRNPLCRGRASPFPGGTLPLFDPVPAACPLLVAPFPCCACLPSCVHTCVRACVHAAFHCLRNASSTGFAFASLFLSSLVTAPFFVSFSIGSLRF